MQVGSTELISCYLIKLYGEFTDNKSIKFFSDDQHIY